jgi:hypothetical protein
MGKIRTPIKGLSCHLNTPLLTMKGAAPHMSYEGIRPHVDGCTLLIDCLRIENQP